MHCESMNHMVCIASKSKYEECEENIPSKEYSYTVFDSIIYLVGE